ncbi:hypothetical protein MPTK1_1g11440 [Marchantia polymorpha subsp. ruderalis]|uniref:Uncharacterized protein n=2 Tax=Marchantia polymorpha TaxID=3197 RepID=A0AAF6AP06_MARPO|nr:hypothetical protein MARPO_0014s0082 [Marchantia polymorpha]BBM98176.1 hypothetical protein Mp_1g11440 [Marchantia polymorpha subsp. ruderalis]|eukprot:PTQ45547.1 hypothetical protein MARPO_0014s0082 [Marchantia polymorpha]
MSQPEQKVHPSVYILNSWHRRAQSALEHLSTKPMPTIIIKPSFIPSSPCSGHHPVRQYAPMVSNLYLHHSKWVRMESKRLMYECCRTLRTSKDGILCGKNNSPLLIEEIKAKENHAIGPKK